MRLGWLGSSRLSRAEKQTGSGSRRDQAAVLFAFVTILCAGTVFAISKGTALLMPGPLASAHGAIETCSTCHTKSGNGKLSWVHGLVAGDPLADSKACLTCHKMPETALNAHSAPVALLKSSTERQTKVAAAASAPQSARAQDMAFPTHEIVARGVYCATCHQEHQGTNFDLNKISNERCRSCHVVKFDSFDGHHPKFENYPFERRTRIVYDHAAHFGKHYPEVAKKEPAKRIPDTCATCHNSTGDTRVMGLAPFEQTCAGCHLNQITGKERVSGPKGIAFLTVPGIDLQSMKAKNAAIGEWPDASEAALTPFMKVMISRSERGRALITSVGGLNLQDLSTASSEQIKAVTDLAWEIKSLFHSLISKKAPDVFSELNTGGGAKFSSDLASDLTASIPRDVVIAAQKQWLPNLAAEMAKGPGASDRHPDGWNAVATDPSAAAAADPEAVSVHEETHKSEEPEQTPKGDGPAAGGNVAKKRNRDPAPCSLRVLGQCLVSKSEGSGAAANPEASKGATVAPELPGAMRAGLADAAKAAKLKALAENAGAPAATSKGPKGKEAGQTDDLLFPTEEEQREINARNKKAGKTAPALAPDRSAAGASAASPDPATAEPHSIESAVDAESWAEHGGWYQQDYAIFYRPAGHKDKFIASWLKLTGSQVPNGDKSPLASVFDFLTSKDAQGSCTKCHSIDAVDGHRRRVNFTPLSVVEKQGRFTRFIHEPHFGVIGNRGCLACHELKSGMPGAEAAPAATTAASSDPAGGTGAVKGVSPYLKGYEQSNPHTFASEFGDVKKDRCQTCHTASMARQDCLTCHQYHVNGVITPITNTKLPIE